MLHSFKARAFGAFTFIAIIGAEEIPEIIPEAKEPLTPVFSGSRKGGHWVTHEIVAPPTIKVLQERHQEKHLARIAMLQVEDEMVLQVIINAVTKELI